MLTQRKIGLMRDLQLLEQRTQPYGVRKGLVSGVEGLADQRQVPRATLPRPRAHPLGRVALWQVRRCDHVWWS